jgi:hypothetical protein
MVENSVWERLSFVILIDPFGGCNVAFGQPTAML